MPKGYKEDGSYAGKTFKKGNKPWLTGLTKETNETLNRMSKIPRTKEWKEKISKSHMGRKKNYDVWNKGKKGLQESHRRGLTMEEEYGIKKSSEIKNKVSKGVKKYYKENPEHKEITGKSFKKSSNLEKEICAKIADKFEGIFFPFSVCDRIAIKDKTVFFVEMKSLKYPELRENQKKLKEFIEKINSENVKYLVIRGKEGAEKFCI